MAKFTDKLADKILTLIEEDNYTITEICRIVGISRKMFYEWKNTRTSFAQALDEAVEAREEKLKQQARQAMRKKLEGYKQIETKITYVASKDSNSPDTLVVKEYVVKEKYCLPETSAITHTLSDKSVDIKGQKHTQPSSPFVITVDSEKTKRNFEILQERLSKNAG